MRAQQKTVSILGRRWRVYRGYPGKDADGFCETPRKPGKRVCFPQDGSLRALQVTIHELTHAAAYDMFDEDWVAEFADAVGRVLWREGWRKT